MAPVFFLLLAAVSVFAAPDYKDLVQYRHYRAKASIIEGVPAGIEEFPFIVSLQYTETVRKFSRHLPQCSGTIITQDWVLTAAKCLDTNFESHGDEHFLLTHVRAGSSHNDKGGILRSVLETVSHEYPPHDIGLIKVDQPCLLNGATMALARLPQQDDPIPVGKLATIVGWGEICRHHYLPAILMRQEVVVISSADCNAAWSSGTHHHVAVTNSSICTEFDHHEWPSSVFLGDEGGPVVVNGEVVGIVSEFDDLHPTYLPNAHTRVSSYIDWIEDKVGQLPTSEEIDYNTTVC